MRCVINPENMLSPEGVFGGNPLFYWIYGMAAHIVPCWLAYVIAGVVIMLILINAVLLGAAIVSWGERRLLGRFQNRVGPNRWGPFGALQPIADLAKLITKEDIIPYGADRLAFTAVPVIMVASLLVATAVIPFAKDVALVDLNVGVLFVLAVSSITSIAIFTAGWASNNRYALFGAGRAVAVLISYEVPVVLSLLGVVVVAGSMSLGDIVAAQAVPFFLVQPLAFFVFPGRHVSGAEPHALRRGRGGIGDHRRLSHGVQRDQVCADPSGGVRRRAVRVGPDRDAVPGRVGRAGCRLARMAVVPDQDVHRDLPVRVDQVHVPEAAAGPDHGGVLEVPDAVELHQPGGGSAGGLLPEGRERGVDRVGPVDHDRDQHSGGGGFDSVFRANHPAESTHNVAHRRSQRAAGAGRFDD